MPPTLLEVADAHQTRLDGIADLAGRRAARLFRQMDVQNLDLSWQFTAPQIVTTVSRAQVAAARQATAYTNKVAELERAYVEPARLVPEAFAGVTKEGREVAPELFAAVTATKKMIGAGVGFPTAFRAGAQFMALLASTVVRDMGRAADATIATGKGFTYSVRVVSAGACSRCAILAGVKGYRTDFQRHPGCRCTSLPLMDATDAPQGFYRSPEDYYESLSQSERERVFTKAGAEAIEAGANPVNVVNARRGALTSTKRADGSYSLARLQPTTIGIRADGTPLQVFSTPEATSARGTFGRRQNLDVRRAGDRYRRTSTVRLMPEQIMKMASTPERARELLERYGYLY